MSHRQNNNMNDEQGITHMNEMGEHLNNSDEMHDINNNVYIDANGEMVNMSNMMSETNINAKPGQFPALKTPGRMLPIGTSTSRLSVEIGGTMNEFNAKQAQPVWRISDETKHIFGGPGNGALLNSSNKLPKQSILQQVKLLSVQNTFPVSLGVNLTGVDGNVFSHKGDKFAEIVFPHTNWHGEKVLSQNDVRSTNNFKARYPDYTGVSLREKGIVVIPGKDYKYVAVDHPVVDMMRANSDMLQSNIDDQLTIDGQWKKVDDEVYELCMSQLEKQLENDIPASDLNNFMVSAEKVGGGQKWNNTNDMIIPIGSNIEEQMDKTHHLKLMLELQYNHM